MKCLYHYQLLKVFFAELTEEELESRYENLLREIAHLKYLMGFSLFEIAKMTAEDRIFYMKWINERKKKEYEASQPKASEPSLPVRNFQ